VNYPPSISLALLPTKIERLPRLSNELGGIELFIKRDDLTGSVNSGNKIRKLEFVLAGALHKKADTLITCGGIQSNHSRATASVAARYGLECSLFLKGKETTPPDGNLLLDKVLGAHVNVITEQDYLVVDRIMEEEAERLRSHGRNPYVIPEGASDWLGAFGYVKAAEEIRNQLDAAGISVDRIVFACGSGGTYAGLLMGKKIFGLSARLTAFNVCQTPEHFVEKIHGICDEANKRLGLGLDFAKDEIEVIGGYVGEAYARPYPEVTRLIKKVAQTEGIILDPVYTGKAMYGLLDLISKGKIEKGSRILFIHTGGIFSLFAYKDELTQTKKNFKL
jgi:D-cysteine desulfhydrase